MWVSLPKHEAEKKFTEYSIKAFAYAVG